MESAGKMLLRWIYEGLRESNMARTPCSMGIKEIGMGNGNEKLEWKGTPVPGKNVLG